MLFGPFADAFMADFDEVELYQFDKLLLAPDPDVYDWIVGRAAPDVEYDTPVLVKIVAFYDQRYA